MSLYDYKLSQEISAQDYPFYALIMACFRKADTHNLEKLHEAFPTTWYEFDDRYNAPGGLIGDELREQIASELPETILGREVIIEEASPRRIHLILGDFSISDDPDTSPLALD